MGTGIEGARQRRGSRGPGSWEAEGEMQRGCGVERSKPGEWGD